jgi:anti-sigma B factor antagonist
MTLREGVITVKQFPEKLNGREVKLFLRELKRCMNIDRPGIVLDCSKMRLMDRSAVLLLLCCLEEAMKRNGDIRLAALPAEAKAILELTRVGRIFEIFDTNDDATNSFCRLPAGASSHQFLPGGSHRVS